MQHRRLPFAAIFLLMPIAAQADAMRCGSRLVYDGDAMSKVETLCGKPSQVTSSTLVKPQTIWRNGRPYPLGETVVQVETWIYNFGPQKFMRKLRFEDGLLVQIETLDYGYHEP